MCTFSWKVSVGIYKDFSFQIDSGKMFRSVMMVKVPASSIHSMYLSYFSVLVFLVDHLFQDYFATCKSLGTELQRILIIIKSQEVTSS